MFPWLSNGHIGFDLQLDREGHFKVKFEKMPYVSQNELELEKNLAVRMNSDPANQGEIYQ